jgi:metal-responsive CopG/Arc/MetJ family transcriptional regulator
MINISISLPENLVREIDEGKGDVSRSRFVKRLLQIGIQQSFADKKGGNK